MKIKTHKYTNKTKPRAQTGAMLLLALVFMATFIVVFTGLSSLQFSYFNYSNKKTLQEQTFQAAEAGIHRFRWALARFFPDTNKIESQQFQGELKDPEGDTVARYSLQVIPKKYCGETYFYDVYSTATSTQDETVTSKIYARFLRPTVADFAYLSNEGVWWGQDEVVVGPQHVNGGMRMDGINKSVSSSAVATYFCDRSYGCRPPQRKPGIWGSGPNKHLWKFPENFVDFDSFTIPYSRLESYARAQGSFLPKISRNNGRKGYRLVFRPDGTVDVYRVLRTRYHWGWDKYSRWRRDYFTITRQRFFKKINVDENCPIIFAKDRVWIEGAVKGKVTVIAADPNSRYDPDVIINNNVYYASNNASNNLDMYDGLTVVAEGSIFIPANSPYNLELHGVFIAQKGYFGRKYYPCLFYGSLMTKNKITVIGSVISKKRGVTAWVGARGCRYIPSLGTRINGYPFSESSYNRYLANDPPAFTPIFKNEFEIVNWQDLK